MKRLLGLIFGIAFVVSGGWSQVAVPNDAPATKEDVEKLLVALQVRERTQDIMENSRKRTKTMMADILRKEVPEASPEQLTQLQDMIKEMIDGVYQDYPIDAVLQDMVPIYQRHLTESDANELIAFYSSPVGRKVLRELPAITAEAMQVSTSHLQPRLEEQSTS